MSDLKTRYPTWNYRYVLYAKSKNMSPSECLEKDEGTFGYMIWIQKNVNEYEKLKNEDGKTYKKAVANQNAFDLWLINKYGININ